MFSFGEKDEPPPCSVRNTTGAHSFHCSVGYCLPVNFILPLKQSIAEFATFGLPLYG